MSYSVIENYLRKWIDQMRWQRLLSIQNLGRMLANRGILNYAERRCVSV